MIKIVKITSDSQKRPEESVEDNLQQLFYIYVIIIF